METAPSEPRGKPKSNRLWKSQQTKRHSAIYKDKPLKSTWQKKVDERNNKKLMKLHEKQLKDERSQRLEAMRKRQEINKKRREENARKAEVVQEIRDTRKVKRMRKKQLRQLQKR